MTGPTEEESKQQFTFEHEDAEGRVRPVTFEDEGDQRIANFVADFFSGHGITGVRWVDNEGEDDEGPT